MHTVTTIMSGEIDWFLVIGPIIVYIYIQIKSGGGGFGGSNDGFG